MNIQNFVNRMLVVLVLMLSAAGGLLLFAWVVNGDEPETPLADEVPSGLEEGHALYEANCMACHGADGQGRPGHFPPLASHVPEMLTREGGRAYLIDVLLHGVAGETEVQGIEYDGFMPGMEALSDEELVRVLDYLTHAWGNDEALPDGHEAFDPSEVAERREAEKTAREVGESQPR